MQSGLITSQESKLRRLSLDPLFAPAGIAVIGASADNGRIGGRIVGYLKQNFRGALYPINPSRDRIQDLRAWPTIAAVGGAVDLALVSIPAAAAVDALQDCADAGVRAAIVFSSGFAEIGEAGAILQQRIREIAVKGEMAILGPNCLGAMNVHTGVTATFSIALDITPLHPGNVAIVSQSGAFAAHVLALTGQRGLGLSKWVTTGNECAVDTADILAYLAEDPATEIIMLYLEGCRDGPKLRGALDMARRAGKPVIAIKVGRSDAGARAALSHTAAIAGSDQGYDALFDATGVHRVKNVDDFIDVAAAASGRRLPRGNRVGLVSMSGGVGILMADRCGDLGLVVPTLPDELQSRLSDILPHSSVANPIDVTAQIINQPELFGETIDAVLDSTVCDALAIFLTTVAYAPKLRAPLMAVFRELRRKHPQSVLGVCMLAPEDVRQELSTLGYIQIEEPSRLIETIAALCDIRARLEMLGPRATKPDPALLLALGAGLIGEHAAKSELSDVGVPFALERLATSAAEAAKIAELIGFPAAMKIASPDIPHKSEIGGVILDLPDAESVTTAFGTLMARAAAMAPHAAIEGMLVSKMISDGIEIIVGGRIDEVAGPLVTVGAGGIFVEVMRDSATACAPVSMAEAMGLIGRLRIAPILHGARGRPAVDVPALAEIVALLSRIVAANADRIDTLEINPLIVGARGTGAFGVDALIVPKAERSPKV
jgi:acetate---CoA ligase (ADP-forming)